MPDAPLIPMLPMEFIHRVAAEHACVAAGAEAPAMAVVPRPPSPQPPESPDGEPQAARRRRTRHPGYSRGRQWVQRRAYVLFRDQGVCAYCGGPANTVDHVVPRCRGGAHTADNLVACCGACNLDKGNLDVVEFVTTKRLTTP